MRDPEYFDVAMEEVPGMKDLVQRQIIPHVQGFSSKHIYSVEKVMTIIVCNLYVKWCHGMTMTFCLDDKAYSRKKIAYAVSNIFVTHISKSFKVLERLGMIVINRRNRPNGRVAKIPSQAIPSNWLIQNFFMRVSFPFAVPEKDLVILREEKKKGSSSPGRRIWVKRQDPNAAFRWQFLEDWNRHTGAATVTARLVS